MEFPRKNLRKYDTETNVAFKNAVIEEMVMPAYLQAIDDYRGEGFTDDNFFVEDEVQDDGVRRVYDLFAEKQDDGYVALTMASREYTTLEPSNEATDLIQQEIQDLAVDNDVKVRLNEDLFETVETYTQRVYYVQFNGEGGSLRVETIMGYAVQELEIDTPTQDVSPGPHDHLEHDTTFGSDEIQGLVEVLMSLGLISKAEVINCVQRDWGV